MTRRSHFVGVLARVRIHNMMVLLVTYQLGRYAARDNATPHRKVLEYCNRWLYLFSLVNPVPVL